MPLPILPSRRQIRLSVSRSSLIPEVSIASAAVAVTTTIHWLLKIRLGESSPVILFVATAAALTFWRGLGPGMVASSMGSAIASFLSALPFNAFAHHGANIPIDYLLMFTGSMFTCFLIYRLRVDHEEAELVRSRRDNSLVFVSHELRQPLSNIMLAADILERDSSEETRSRVTKLISRSATRLGALIDDLADVSLLQSNAIRLVSAVLRLQDVVLATTDAVKPGIERKQQRLETNMTLDPPLWLHGDAIRLEQALGNVVSNASKYSPEGAEISISTRQEEGWGVIVVKDTGVGIRRDMLEAIFDPFVRESPTQAEGLGVGLTLARNVITQHGGQITAHSAGPGRGSVFMIRLPLANGPDGAV